MKCKRSDSYSGRGRYTNDRSGVDKHTIAGEFGIILVERVKTSLKIGTNIKL